MVLESSFSFAARTYQPVRPLTIDMKLLSGRVTARWFDPANAAYVAIAGCPFSNTGTQTFAAPRRNHDGDRDWVLVLEVN